MDSNWFAWPLVDVVEAVRSHPPSPTPLLLLLLLLPHTRFPPIDAPSQLKERWILSADGLGTKLCQHQCARKTFSGGLQLLLLLIVRYSGWSNINSHDNTIVRGCGRGGEMVDGGGVGKAEYCECRSESIIENTLERMCWYGEKKWEVECGIVSFWWSLTHTLTHRGAIS